MLTLRAQTGWVHRLGCIAVLTGVMGAGGCGDDGGGDTGETDDTGETEGDEGVAYACGDLVSYTPGDACAASDIAYRPGADDMYGACVSDDGGYSLISDTPSSIARVQAYADILTILGDTPDADAFTEARAKYSEEEGLESRLQRRENLWEAPVPESDWDPGVDGDKQCTVLANTEAYPQRCAGPALIAPIMNDAFASGQTGEGDPAVHRARIEAAGLWFLYLSVFKEANTCFTGAAKDCDSAWAYYTGGFDRAGGIGLAAEVRRVDAPTHEAIWDGVAGFRCVRDLHPADDTPAISDLTEEGQELLCHVQTQLGAALDEGLMSVVHDRLTTFAGLDSGDAEIEARWAFLEVLGPVLDRAGTGLDATTYAPVQALWSGGVPSAEDAQAAADALASTFSCG